MRIDSHQHFWKYHPVKDAWITDDMKIIQKDFMPADLYPLLQQNKMDGCVAVQADQSEEETKFLLELAQENDFIKGVVGWVDLCAENIEERLQYFSQFKKLKGFRHIVQAEAQDDFLLREDFCNGISLLQKFGYTYDILVLPKHLPVVIEFVKRFPSQPFVIDHLAKPMIKEKKIDDWAKDMEQLSHFPNLFCKLSGMVTEADLLNHKPEDFKPYIDIVINNFGTDRILFGSDWPVCLLAGGYDNCCKILGQNTDSLASSEKEKLWGGNACNFYNLQD